MMTPAQLLIPRKRVLADYPHSPYQIGDIITFDQFDRAILTKTQYRYEFGDTIIQANMASIGEFETYTALFEKVFWFENRQKHDLPAYLRKIIDGHETIRKVKHYEYPFAIFDGLYEWRLDYTKPATEQEFINFQNKHNG